MNSYLLLLYCIILSSIVMGQGCEERRTCGDCLADSECFWCLDQASDAVSVFPKCFSRLQEHQCQIIMDPQSSTEVLESAPLNPNSGSGSNIVQISPQSVAVKLRPLDEDGHRLEFGIAQSSQYPVDIYFLLDLSFSMESSRNNFAKQAGDIIDGIKSISGDLHVGFGSFVEKNLPPFTSAVPSFNCPADDPNCTPPYSFYHRVTLNGDMSAEDFTQEVLAAPLAGNVDEPEGGLDALMQAMVCTDRVGWREDSRKIVLLATDRDYHYALDGKLAGVLERNDGLCHLNGTEGGPGYYTHSALLDYPSVSQVGAAARGGSFVVIFAVIPQYREIWEALSGLVQGSSVETLEEDGANIVDLIEEKYEEITSSIQLRVENVPADVSVILKSTCGRRRGEEIETDRCEHVELGTEVRFAAEIKARACLDSPQNITIYPEGINQELTVEVDTICECEDCLGGGFDAPECSGRGRNECGVCNCLEGYSGISCECDESSFEKQGGDKTCRDPKSPDQICSGLGSCQCGTCVCFDPSKNYGLFCECDDTTCARDAQNRLCSAHGRCSCGRCICSEGWIGVDCSCSTSKNSCQSPYNMEICSKSGECSCNRCNCMQDQDGGLFSGTYCEKAPGELEPCLVLKDCVECLAFNSGPLSNGEFDENDKPICPLHCMNLEYSEVMPTNATEQIDQACEFENEARCTYRYTSVLSPEKQVSVMLLLTDEGEKEVCPNVNAMAISLGMFGLIVLLGLLTLLIYKCYLVVDDRRIYAKFEQEAKQLQYATNQNPNDIYKSPITEYKNPMYGKAIN